MKKILIGISIMGLLGSIVVWFIAAFSHPDMTRIQLFLSYWYLNIVALVSAGTLIIFTIKA